MLDLARMRRVRLRPRPHAQIAIANTLLWPNYSFLPGVEIRVEGDERLPDEPVIFAMNHTDRYNYFPFQYALYRRHNRFTATWVKGKYYEHPVIAAFMEMTTNIPTVSRGYLIVRDFMQTVGRRPDDVEYRAMRRWVDGVFAGEAVEPPENLPRVLTDSPRTILGVDFSPQRESWAQAICRLFDAMIQEFVRLNREVVDLGLDLLVFPEGTRSVRLTQGRTGMAQIALHTPRPIVPVGCNGSHHVYPGNSPWARRGRITYRLGAPITLAEQRPFVPPAAFAPFSAKAEVEHRDRFEGLTKLVMERIEGLLDEEHRAVEGARCISASERFV